MRFPRTLARLIACVALIACALSPVDAARPLGAPRARPFGRALRQSDDEAIAAFAVNSWGLPVNTWKAASTKSSSHVLPRMQEHHSTLHRTAHGWIEGYVPKEYAPLTAAIVSYVLLVLPFCAAYAVFKAMDALLSIQKLLLAVNVYNACYCALLVVINLWTGNEPMASLQESNEADYLILQFFKCAAYGAFIVIQVVHVCMLWSTRAENMKVAAVGNLALSLCIGFHYFIRVWSPAMEGHPPKTSALSYTLYTTMFAAMAFSHYVKPDKGERAMAAQANAAMAGNDENKQF